MAFENLIIGLDFLEEAGFATRLLRDKNVLTKNTKKRTINVPNDAMRVIHSRLVGYLRNLPIEYRYATACLPGCSTRKNVQRHRGNRFFYLIDLKNAYHCVDSKKLAKMLLKVDASLVGQEKEIKTFLEKYCFSKVGGLATGAPASPDLFNLYCLFSVDVPLEKIIKKYGITYSRYLDDLTFSSKKPISRKMRKEIRKIIEKAGFRVNHMKSEVKDLKKGPIFINGIGLESGGRIFVPRDFTRHVRGLIHNGIYSPELRPKIEGAMGVFRSATDYGALNQTEKRIVNEYKTFRKVVS